MSEVYARSRDILGRITDIERQIFDLKSTQSAGRDVFIPKVTVTNQPYDFTATSSLNGGYVVRFKANSQSNPWGRLRMEVWIGTPSTPATSSDVVNTVQFLPTQSVDGWLVWLGSIYPASGSPTVYVKFRVLATDSGTLTVETA